MRRSWSSALETSTARRQDASAPSLRSCPSGRAAAGAADGCRCGPAAGACCPVRRFRCRGVVLHADDREPESPRPQSRFRPAPIWPSPIALDRAQSVIVPRKHQQLLNLKILSSAFGDVGESRGSTSGDVRRHGADDAPGGAADDGSVTDLDDHSPPSTPFHDQSALVSSLRGRGGR